MDNLAKLLNITRTAVQQHVVALQRGGYVGKHQLKATAGRPGWLYILTPSGINLFPKRYSWFAQALLESVKHQLGTDAVATYLENIGKSMAQEFRGRLTAETDAERIEQVATMMLELGYDARALPGNQGALPIIDARNCLYHELAANHEDVCRLDLVFLSNMLGREVNHDACMVRGGASCQFRFGKKQTKEK